MRVIYWEEAAADTSSLDSRAQAMVPPEGQKYVEIRHTGSYHVPSYFSYEVQHAGGAVTHKQVTGDVRPYGN